MQEGFVEDGILPLDDPAASRGRRIRTSIAAVITLPLRLPGGAGQRLTARAQWLGPESNRLLMRFKHP